jgi:MSHA biogenesis protein MshQ
MPSTFGPETTDLPVSLSAQLWDGERFLVNDDDNCTRIDPALLSIVEDPLALEPVPAGFEDKLSLGKNPAQSLVLGAPMATGDVVFKYDAPAWLEWGMWSEDSQGDPSATASFGLYGGHDRVISWREMYN